jgi:hypothetical protein
LGNVQLSTGTIDLSQGRQSRSNTEQVRDAMNGASVNVAQYTSGMPLPLPLPIWAYLHVWVVVLGQCSFDRHVLLRQSWGISVAWMARSPNKINY